MQNKSPLSILLVLIALATVILLSYGLPEPRVQGPNVSEVQETGSAEIANYGKLPLYFFENQGRLDPAVKYYIPGGNKNVYFAPSGVVYELFAAPGRAEAPRVVPASYGAEEATARASRDRWAVKLGFVGANPNPLVVGGEQAGEMNFFRGDRASWRTGVPAHRSVRYERLWPGIDLLLKAEGPHLKYEFRVAAGHDPNEIRFFYEGADNFVNEAGQIEVTTPVGGFVDERPYAYQVVGGERLAVPVSYSETARSDDADAYGFQLGAYDPRHPIIIDPAVLVYAGYIGGSAQDEAYGVDVDADGNAYIVGTTKSSEMTFPVTVGPQLTFDNRTSDVFVAKVDATGTRLIYAGYVGGTDFDHGEAIAVDSAGNAYITGWTRSTDFPRRGSLDSSHNGRKDSFVAKISADGTRLIYSGYVGGNQEDEGQGIDVDADGNAYLVGRTQSSHTTFPVLGGPDLTFNGGNSDAFVAKVDAGGALAYAGYIGGAAFDSGLGIVAGPQGHAFVTGYTKSTADTFPVAGGPMPEFNGSEDAFVSKVSADGGSLVYSGYLGGPLADRGHGIGIDAAGNAYIGGLTSSPPDTNFPASVGPSLEFGGLVDAFVAKISADGGTILYAGYIGGLLDDRANAIAVDALGNVFVCGTTLSDQQTFPVSVGPDLTWDGGREAFVAKVNASGRGLDFATYIGDVGDERARGIAVDPRGTAYVVGGTSSPAAEFPTAGPDLSFNGLADAFVAKIDATIILPGGIVNAASFAPGPLAPGEIVSIFGSGIGPISGVGARLDGSGRVASNVAGARVLFDGVPAPLFFVRSDQINAQAPYSLDGKDQVRVQVMFQDLPSEEETFPVGESAPGVFSLPGNPSLAIAVHSDGSLNSFGNPAKAGDVVIFFATGEGQTDPPGIDGKLATGPLPRLPRPRLPVSLTIGGREAQITFAGSAPNFAGLLQLNARIPAESNGDGAEVVLTVGSASSHSGLTMSVRE